ncbi:hypothetical protein N752_26820 [Desulforamulus aquiferis]|nr:hypothetical protein [Desulforamulus aquiferis]RYD02066.1 hypothetical protein N752_26820 [Desulforamulus aquiferis]
MHTILTVAGLVIVAVGGFIAFDLTRPPDLRSHMGTTASLIISSGPGQVLDIIQRKWAMNMKLLKYTVWSRILLASLAVLALLFYRPRGVMQNIKDKYPYLYKGFIGVLTGALVAFAFNDSGVVAAATTMIFAAPPLVYLVLTEQKGICRSISLTPFCLDRRTLLLMEYSRVKEKSIENIGKLINIVK